MWNKILIYLNKFLGWPNDQKKIELAMGKLWRPMGKDNENMVLIYVERKMT
jgi:hypothetical protein